MRTEGRTHPPEGAISEPAGAGSPLCPLVSLGIDAPVGPARTVRRYRCFPESPGKLGKLLGNALGDVDLPGLGAALGFGEDVVPAPSLGIYRSEYCRAES